jgi:hypothetical protein
MFIEFDFYYIVKVNPHWPYSNPYDFCPNVYTHFIEVGN